MNKLLVAIGVLLLIGGVIAGGFTQSTTFLWGAYTKTTTPYQQFSLPLMIVGVAALVAGIFLKEQALQQ